MYYLIYYWFMLFQIPDTILRVDRIRQLTIEDDFDELSAELRLLQSLLKYQTYSIRPRLNRLRLSAMKAFDVLCSNNDNDMVNIEENETNAQTAEEWETNIIIKLAELTVCEISHIC